MIKHHAMVPWPRTLINFPIILIAITQEYIWAAAVMWDPLAVHVTAVAILAQFMPPRIIVAVLIFVSTLAACSFMMKRRMNNLLGLVPQQFMLYLSAGGSAQAIWFGQFADGVERSQAFLLADQCSSILVAFFHTWAMFLLIKYSED